MKTKLESDTGSNPPACSVLFLDVDGVLNRCGKSAQGLETDKCEMLARIVAEADPVIVVSSTWRISDRGMERLTLLFRQIGARFGGITPYHTGRTEGGLYIAKARGNEIQEWLDDNGKPARFVILDDDSDMGHLLPHLVKTESFVGLTPEITQRVIDALNAELTRPESKS
jgi:hypothetical protein